MKKKIYNIILFFLIIALVAVCSIIYKDYKKMYDVIKTYDDIKEQCVSNTAKSDIRKIDWDKLYKINSDIVAWIEIPGTPVDYPIVKTTDYDYYLTHDIHKKYSQYGSLFIDERLRNNLFKSKNLIVYGHNMGKWTDVMFSSLMKYKNQDFYNKHKYVYFYTKDGKEKYKIVGIRETSSSSDAYKVEFTDGEYQQWINEVVFPMDNTREINKVLTLSTCTYGSDRLVLHCIMAEN